MSAITQRVLAALYLSDHVPELIKQGRAIVKAMTGNPATPDPTPSLLVVTAALDKLEDADLATATGAVGTFQAREQQKFLVEAMLRQLEAYVQVLCAADQGQAAILILGAGMSLRKGSTRHKPELSARQDGTLALVLLVGRAARARAYYEWQWSTDQSTWSNLPGTLEAKASFQGFTPMTLYYFRYRVLTKKSTGDWSGVVNLFVK
jgi:hypothetical protein